MKDKVHHYDLLEERLNNMEKALQLQAKEYERRLEVLNNENDRIKSVQDKSIPREVFDRTMDAMNAKTQINTDYINSAKGKGTGMNSLWVIGVAAILLLCSIVSVIIAVISLAKKT